MPSNRLEILLSGNVRDFNQKMQSAEKQADQTMGAIADKARDASVVLAGLAVGAGALTVAFVSKAVEMQQYEQTLTAITGSTEEARQELEKYTKFAATTSFDLPGVVAGATKMRSLKVDVQRFLPLAGDLAAVFDRRIPESSLALSKALSGSQDGITQLQDSYGIAKKELIEAGAEMKNNGAIAVDTSTQLEKLQDAIEKVVKSKFGGAMLAQAQTAAGALSNLEDAVGRLQAALGEELTDDISDAAKYLTSLVEQLEALPGPTKRMIAHGVALTAGVAAMGSALLGLTAAFGPLAVAVIQYNAAAAASATATATSTAAITAATGTNFGFTAATIGSTTAVGGLSGAMATLGTIMSASIPILGAVAVGLALYTHHLGEVNAAKEEMIRHQERAADAYREEKKLAIEAAAALKEYAGNAEAAGKALEEAFRKAGKTEVDVSQAIAGLMQQLTQAQEAGDKATEKRIRDRIIALRHAKEGLAGEYKKQQEAEKKRADAAKQAIESQTAAIEDYKAKASAGYYETAEAQLAALDSILSGMDKEHKQFKKLSLSRVKLARQVADESRKAELDASLHKLEMLRVYGDKRLKDQEEVLAQILENEKLTADERRKIELDLLKVQESIRKKADADRKKADADREKAHRDQVAAARESAQSKKRSIDSEKRLIELEEQRLAEQLAQGKDVSAQLTEQIKKRQELEEASLRQAASVEKLGKTGSEQAEIQKRLTNDIKAVRLQAQRDAEKVEQKSFMARKKALLETLKLHEEMVKTRSDMGRDVTEQDLVSVAKERLQIAEAQLRLEAQIASAQASPEDKARIAKALEMDLLKLREGSAESLARATQELKKQQDALDKNKGATLGGVKSLHEFAKEMSDQFAGQNSSKDDSQEKPNVQKASNQLGVNPNAQAPVMTDAQIKMLAKALKPEVKIVPPKGGSAMDTKGWAWESKQS